PLRLAVDDGVFSSKTKVALEERGRAMPGGPPAGAAAPPLATRESGTVSGDGTWMGPTPSRLGQIRLSLGAKTCRRVSDALPTERVAPCQPPIERGPITIFRRGSRSGKNTKECSLKSRYQLRLEGCLNSTAAPRQELACSTPSQGGLLMFSFFRQWARNGTRKGAQAPAVRRLECESLEDRTLPSLTGAQLFARSLPLADHAVVASVPGGRSVVAWEVAVSSRDHDIKAQVFDSSGHKLGGVIAVASGRVNQYTPTVAVNAAGQFV